MTETKEKRPAHEVILAILEQMHRDPAPYDCGYHGEDKPPNEGERRVILLCDILTQMIIPREHRQNVCERLTHFVDHSACYGTAVYIGNTSAKIRKDDAD